MKYISWILVSFFIFIRVVIEVFSYILGQSLIKNFNVRQDLFVDTYGVAKNIYGLNTLLLYRLIVDFALLVTLLALGRNYRANMRKERGPVYRR